MSLNCIIKESVGHVIYGLSKLVAARAHNRPRTATSWKFYQRFKFLIQNYLEYLRRYEVTKDERWIHHSAAELILYDLVNLNYYNIVKFKRKTHIHFPFHIIINLYIYNLFQYRFQESHKQLLQNTGKSNWIELSTSSMQLLLTYTQQAKRRRPLRTNEKYKNALHKTYLLYYEEYCTRVD